MSQDNWLSAMLVCGVGAESLEQGLGPAHGRVHVALNLQSTHVLFSSENYKSPFESFDLRLSLSNTLCASCISILKHQQSQ
jgi:hypothetical protein